MYLLGSRRCQTLHPAPFAYTPRFAPQYSYFPSTSEGQLDHHLTTKRTSTDHAFYPQTFQCPDLIPYESKEGTNYDCKTLAPDNRRELVRQTFASSGGHDTDDIAVVQGGIDDAFLT